jgi:hypothetical protein
MAKPYARAFAQISCVLAAIVATAACTWTSDDRYAQGELTCSDARSCDAMWKAAESWIASNSALKLAERSKSLLETRCGRQAESFACYTVMRQPLRSGETRINIYVACGNDFIGCEQPATKLRNQLTAAMLGAGDAKGTAYTSTAN